MYQLISLLAFLLGAAVALPQFQQNQYNYRPASQYKQVPAFVIQPAAPQYTRQPVVAAPQPAAYSYPAVKPILILKQSQDNNFDGTFNYDFQSENGIGVQTNGYVKNAGTQDEAQVIQGSYSYTAPDGTPITTNWYADETGFHADGAHLPVPPPVPEAIARSLAYIQSLPQEQLKKYN